MKTFLATDYLKAGCHFANEAPLPFMGVHQATAGRVCDTGCSWYEGGKCAGYRALTATPKGQEVRAEAGETVRQEAARRGLSISEIRRQRAAR